MAAEPAISKNATAEWRDSARNADWKTCVACRPHPEPAVLPDSNVFETQLAAPLSTPLSTRLALATLRRARDSDANALSALMRDTFRDAYGHCSSPANVARFLDAHYRPALKQREIADSGRKARPPSSSICCPCDALTQGIRPSSRKIWADVTRPYPSINPCTSTGTP